MISMYCGGHGEPLPCKTCAANLARKRQRETRRPMDVDELCGMLSKASEHCALGEPEDVQKLLGEAIRYVRARQVPRK